MRFSLVRAGSSSMFLVEGRDDDNGWVGKLGSWGGTEVLHELTVASLVASKQ